MKNTDIEPQIDLASIRHFINGIDEQILELIGSRIGLVDEVIEYKEHHDLPTRDIARENEHIRELIALSKEKGIPPGAIEMIFRAIMNASVGYQNHNRGNLEHQPMPKSYYCETCGWNTAGISSEEHFGRKTCSACHNLLYLPPIKHRPRK